MEVLITMAVVVVVVLVVCLINRGIKHLLGMVDRAREVRRWTKGERRRYESGQGTQCFTSNDDGLTVKQFFRKHPFGLYAFIYIVYNKKDRQETGSFDRDQYFIVTQYPWSMINMQLGPSPVWCQLADGNGRLITIKGKSRQDLLRKVLKFVGEFPNVVSYWEKRVKLDIVPALKETQSAFSSPEIARILAHGGSNMTLDESLMDMWLGFESEAKTKSLRPDPHLPIDFANKVTEIMEAKPAPANDKLIGEAAGPSDTTHVETSVEAAQSSGDSACG